MRAFVVCVASERAGAAQPDSETQAGAHVLRELWGWQNHCLSVSVCLSLSHTHTRTHTTVGSSSPS